MIINCHLRLGEYRAALFYLNVVSTSNINLKSDAIVKGDIIAKLKSLANLHYMEGLRLTKINQRQLAKQHFTQALNLYNELIASIENEYLNFEKHTASIYYGSGLCEFKLGQYEDALETLENALKQKNKSETLEKNIIGAIRICKEKPPRSYIQDNKKQSKSQFFIPTEERNDSGLLPEKNNGSKKDNIVSNGI